jgi:hypothetical protein
MHIEVHYTRRNGSNSTPYSIHSFSLFHFPIATATAAATAAAAVVAIAFPSPPHLFILFQHSHLLNCTISLSRFISPCHLY